MPRNIEIKARIADVEALSRLAGPMADTGPVVLEQDDTFFACPRGRLKLRDQFAAGAELIFYQRPDATGPKESFYVRTPVPDAAAMRSLLNLAYGETGRVRKRRVLFLIGRTRVHLDAVEGLGEFMELEVVLREGEPPEEGIADARTIMAALGIGSEQLIEGAYVDHLAQ